MATEEQVFTIISATGTAKSMYMKALDEYKANHAEQAEKLMEEGDQCLIDGHKIHSSLVQEEASGNTQDVSLILVHAEDQFMSAETIKTMVKEFMAVYSELNMLKQSVAQNK